MPISIIPLIQSVGLNSSALRTVKWGDSVNCTSSGIYIISLSSDPHKNQALIDIAPIDRNKLELWMKKVPSIRIDEKPATVEKLHVRLNSFWFPDESIVYIGQTNCTKGLNGRLHQYYNTELGERKPHAGGHWIKTLRILNQLYVHFIPTIRPEESEEQLLINFMNQVSSTARKHLYDPSLPLPFANLELNRGNRKKHGISKSKLSN